MNQTKPNLYASIIEKIFLSKFRPGVREVNFEREDIVKTARKLNVNLPKNLGDLIYSFRYRAELPERIQRHAAKGKVWVIRPAGRSRYCFVMVEDRPLLPNKNISPVKIPDSTPGIISKYALNDEQALLAKVRYNRLVDIFTGVTCYSLQNHLRTTVPKLGQVETDEVYVGIDKKGAQYVFPVQAKNNTGRLSMIQIEQDAAICADKFPFLICRPIAAQFVQDDIIVLFEFEKIKDGIGIILEKHYKLVPPEHITESDLNAYRSHTNPI